MTTIPRTRRPAGIASPVPRRLPERIRRSELAALDDRALVTEAQNGDVDARSELLCRYERLVAAVCHRQLADDRDIEDARQETAERILNGLHQVRQPERIAGWIRAIAVRVCLDVRHGRDRDVVIRADAGADLEHPGPGPEDALLRSDRARELHGHLAGLSDRDRRALWLRDALGHPVATVAGELEVTEGSARVLLSRARDRLRAAYSAVAGLLLLPLLGRRSLRRPGRTPLWGDVAWGAVGQAALAAAALALPLAPTMTAQAATPSAASASAVPAAATTHSAGPTGLGATTAAADASLRRDRLAGRTAGQPPAPAPSTIVDLGAAHVGDEQPDDPPAGQVAVDDDLVEFDLDVYAAEPTDDDPGPGSRPAGDGMVPSVSTPDEAGDTAPQVTVGRKEGGQS